MMKSRLLVIFVVFFIYNCEAQQKKKEETLLEGYWAISEEENVIFLTYKDSNDLTYFDEDYTYRYFIKKDSLFLTDYGYIISKAKILKMTSDSLIIRDKDSNGIFKYYNRKR